MEAPDKIYVSRNFSEDNSPHGLWYLNKSEHDINVEYIRKDALLEWAKAIKADPMIPMNIDKVIEKINTM